jgi:hypothetical protein
MLSSVVNTKGNTVGSRSKTDLAYIAGFLDGDGSLMLQLKRRSDTKLRWRFVCTICLYQDTRHEEPLLWMQQTLGVGYISRRNDGITELRINGLQQTRNIISELLPYLRFKRRQAVVILRAAELLSSTKPARLTKEHLTTLVDYMLVVQSENYVTKKKKTREEALLFLGLTP